MLAQEERKTPEQPIDANTTLEESIDASAAERRSSGRSRKVPSAMEGFVLGSGRKSHTAAEDTPELQDDTVSNEAYRLHTYNMLCRA